ncbi:MAG: 4-vinyl reductase [Gemmatimonadota bacterium]
MGDVILPSGGLAELRRAIEDVSADSGVRALREAGRRLAGDAEVAIAERGGGPLPALPLETFWTELGRYFDEAGWGRIQHEQMNEGIGALVASDWAEADPTEDRGAPGCHISTGLLAELLTRAVGQPMAVMEVECRSQGNEVCRFLFGSPTTLLLVHKKLAQAGSLEDALTSS